ncbi:MAG TPA: GDSL-type esterase/lipase family protein [Blastocatellia bacterium]|nr:GDSL-type esterase/lipase family protein [Blastocatellia bacterium]
MGQLPKAVAASLAIEDPGGEAMRAFYESLMRTEEGERLGITRIIHYGDSHVAADVLTGELRRKFHMEFGDGGPGFILGGRPWQGYSPRGVRSTASPGWDTRGIRTSPDADRRFGFAGASVESHRSDEWIRVESDCRRFELYLLRQPGGGAVDVILDGQMYRSRVSLASARAASAYIEVTARNDGAHAVEIRTISSGVVRVLGLVVERAIPGVVYDALGINGARASRLLGWDWDVLADNLEHRHPNLIIVAYGSNEVGDTDLDLEEYARIFSAVLGRLHAAVPQASLLVISPPDRAIRVNGRWQAIGRMPALVSVQRQAALGAGAGFWDFFSAMGGAGSIQRWASRTQPLAQADRVHLTREGYKLEAEMLYAELMRGYLWELALRDDRRGRCL